MQVARKAQIDERQQPIHSLTKSCIDILSALLIFLFLLMGILPRKMIEKLVC
jgi:hypothetical protein